MPTQEENIQTYVDKMIRRYRTTPIVYEAYETGQAVDIYKQRVKTYLPGVELVGRAILNPTREKVTIIGNGENYDIAFLFSRIELLDKFPLALEGQWLNVDGRMTWYNRQYRIVKAQPSGQVGQTFSLFIALGESYPGKRDG